MEQQDIYRLKRVAVFLGLMYAVAIPITLGVAAYIKANYPPLDPQAFHPRTISRFEEGNAYVIELTPPLRGGAPDTDEYPSQSKLMLYENGAPLGPAHTAHHAIVSMGHGRFSHWSKHKTIIMFSATDNSDPRTNGRTYRFTVPGVK